MNKQPRITAASSAAVTGEDRISALPDELLLVILRGIKPHKQGAKTAALSRRWRSLWSSYPVVEFDHNDCLNPDNSDAVTAEFQKFAHAEIKRLSRGGEGFRMEAFKVSLTARISCSPVLDLLLKLASKKNAQEVSVEIFGKIGRFKLPIKILSNPCAKVIKLKGVMLLSRRRCSPPPLSLNSLRSLSLRRVGIEDRLLAKLMASSPLLEALEIEWVGQLKQISVSDSTNPRLKTLRIAVDPVQEIEIAAKRLETLYLKGVRRKKLRTLAAPQVKFLEIEAEGDGVSSTVSRLPSLRSLVVMVSRYRKALRFSSPRELEELEVVVEGSSELEEIEVNGGPRLARFVLHVKQQLTLLLKKVEIRNANCHCQWELHYFSSSSKVLTRDERYCVVGFISLFSRFDAVKISAGGVMAMSWNRGLGRICDYI